MIEKNYLDEKRKEVERILRNRFSEIRENEYTNITNMIVGIFEYLKINYQTEIDPSIDTEYIIPNISDATFYNRLNQENRNNISEDNDIDGVVFVDSKGRLISGDEPEEINDIIFYQSKSGKDGKPQGDILALMEGLQTVISQEPTEKNEVFTKLINAHNSNKNIKYYPLYICLSTSVKRTDNFELTVGNKLELINSSNDFNIAEINIDDIIVDNNIRFKITENFIPDEKKLKIESVQEYIYPGSPLKSYIVFAHVRDYLEFIKNDNTNQLDEGLFNKNVRGNTGGNVLNKNIRTTFKDGPENFVGDFWWLSNGITITTEGLSIEDSILKMNYPSVINGQQTSRQLFEASTLDDFDKNNPMYSPWKVMIKIFVDEEHDVESGIIISKIIAGLNAQTAINSNSIDLNNDRTFKVQKYLADISDDAKPMYLEIRKGEFKNNLHIRDKGLSDRIISIESLIQYSLSGNIFNVDEKDPVNIGMIRSSKSSIVKKYNGIIFSEENTQKKNAGLWIKLVKIITSFEKLFELSPQEKDTELPYLTFGMFRLLINKSKYNYDGEVFTQEMLNKVLSDLNSNTAEIIKNKMQNMIENNKDITNWDQFSKTAKFEEKLNSIEFN